MYKPAYRKRVSNCRRRHAKPAHVIAARPAAISAATSRRPPTVGRRPPDGFVSENCGLREGLKRRYRFDHIRRDNDNKRVLGPVV
ncbi:hypothetical protein EVAR_28101_1 [Eumeta japonica]|uniref:Uncharacterized protein n=1 Tax=Eumeta variegata TaxID=151549 RepID=A0A4C1W8L4_EUMVA|nr:hypothetical protein EVAR_28101_1 [Eumeta japonica]